MCKQIKECRSYGFWMFKVKEDLCETLQDFIHRLRSRRPSPAEKQKTPKLAGAKDEKRRRDALEKRTPFNSMRSMGIEQDPDELHFKMSTSDRFSGDIGLRRPMNPRYNRLNRISFSHRNHISLSRDIDIFPMIPYPRAQNGRLQ